MNFPVKELFILMSGMTSETKPTRCRLFYLLLILSISYFICFYYPLVIKFHQSGS